MIEINLLPGAGKKKASRSGGGPKLDFAALAGSLSEKVRDKYLAAAVACVIVAGAAFAWLYTTQSAQAASLDERLEKAQKDSAVYAAVVADRDRLEAKRDTLLRQMNIIRSIDEDRFVWPHVMDEVSKALPAYTWLNTIGYVGSPQGSVNTPVLGAKKAPPRPAKPPAGKPAPAKAAPKLETTIARDSVRVRVMGQTVDIQALTRFMRQLEASPFLGDVQLQSSQLAISDGHEVTQFTIDFSYTPPDTTVIRRVPLSLVR